MLETIIKFLTNYLRNKPFRDLLMLVLIGFTAWNSSSFHAMLRERDEVNERNTERIISALTGLRRDMQAVSVDTKRVAAMVKDGSLFDKENK